MPELGGGRAMRRADRRYPLEGSGLLAAAIAAAVPKRNEECCLASQIRPLAQTRIHFAADIVAGSFHASRFIVHAGVAKMPGCVPACCCVCVGFPWVLQVPPPVQTHVC